MACEYGRYGYRRIAALLRADGWRFNHERVGHIRREEGLKVPKRKYKRLRLYFSLFITEGIPDFIRSDNGSEFKAKMLQDWL